VNETPDQKQLTRELDNLAAIASVRQLVTDGAVRAIREAAGLTQADIARGAGCTPSTIANYEAGRRVPSGKAAARYGAALARCLELAK